MAGSSLSLPSIILDEEAIADVSEGDDRVEAILRGTAPATSMVTGLAGELVCELRVGSEGIVFATIRSAKHS